MMTYEFTPNISNYPVANHILEKAKWSADFKFQDGLTYLSLEKAGSDPISLSIPDTSYATHHLPASFFLDAFEKLGITEFDGYEPKEWDLRGWGFYEEDAHVKGHYFEKQHPTKPNCKVMLVGNLKPSDPYLLMIEGSEKNPILMGLPKSILHFIHALETKGFLEHECLSKHDYFTNKL